MPIAHVCMSCGLDLARHRALRDLHYGLPMLICSRCGRAEVRRRHPVQRVWRNFLRVKRATFVALLKIGALFGLGTLTIGVSYIIAEEVELSLVGLRYAYEENATALVSAFVLLPIVTGTFLGSALAHWRPGAQWLVWTCLVFFAGWIVPLPYEAYSDAASTTEANVQYLGVSSGPAPVNAFDWMTWRSALEVFGILWCLSLAGIPFAIGVRRWGSVLRSRRWRKRRIRLRRARNGT